MARLSLDTVVVRSAEPLTAPVDGQLVMLDPRKGQYLALDSIGHQIWKLIERPLTVDALCAELAGEFDVTADTCRSDVLTFLEQLADAELVELD